eukprot:364905-Chlamydomonas_euryale.AAC.9
MPGASFAGKSKRACTEQPLILGMNGTKGRGACSHEHAMRQPRVVGTAGSGTAIGGIVDTAWKRGCAYFSLMAARFGLASMLRWTSASAVTQLPMSGGVYVE